MDRFSEPARGSPNEDVTSPPLESTVDNRCRLLLTRTIWRLGIAEVFVTAFSCEEGVVLRLLRKEFRFGSRRMVSSESPEEGWKSDLAVNAVSRRFILRELEADGGLA